MNKVRRFFVGILCALTLTLSILGVSACKFGPMDTESSSSKGGSSSAAESVGSESSFSSSWNSSNGESGSSSVESSSSCAESSSSSAGSESSSVGSESSEAESTNSGDNNSSEETCAHVWSAWKSNGNGMHVKVCTLGCETVVSEYCAGGTATCLDRAVCAVCGGSYGGYAPDHTFIEVVENAYIVTPATCSEAAIYHKSCQYCHIISEDETFSHGDALEHDWTNWASTGESTHTRSCVNEGCGTVETVDCSGGTATCTKKAICDVCKEEYGEEPTHNWDDGVATGEPTCLVAGERQFTCVAEGCGITKTEMVSATGHNYVDTVTEPTCTMQGYTTHVCDDCGDTYVDSYVSASGHAWGGVEVTCETGRTCGACGAQEAELGHDYQVTGSTEADCENAATETYTCGNCGDVYTEDVSPALGHKKGALLREDWVSGCEYVQIYDCENCDGEVEGERVARHELSASITTHATCQTDGVKTLSCKNCSHTQTETIEKSADYHVWNGGVLSGNVRTYTCTAGCGTTKTAIDASAETQAEISKGDLAGSELKLKDAAISMDSDAVAGLADGNLTLSAGTLGSEDREAATSGMTEEEKAQLGDNPIYNFEASAGGEAITEFSGMVTVTLPYALEGENVDNIAVWYINDEGNLENISATYIIDEAGNGYVTFQTNHFSYYTVTRLTPAERCALYGHQYRHSSVAVSCTVDGYDLHVCIRCTYSYRDNEQPKTGHSYTETVTPATCTTAGKIVKVCNCGHRQENRISALGHNWALVESQAASCESAGYTIYGCQNDSCDASYTERFAQLSHEFEETVVGVTCTANGYTLHDCKNCDYSYTDSLVLTTGHNYTQTWVWSEEDENGNYEWAKLVFTCENCDDTFEIEAEIEKEETDSTCDKHGKDNHVGKVTYNGHNYQDKKEKNKDKSEHKFDGGYKFNKHGHWHQCKDCKGKVNEEEHTLVFLQYSKRPTCIRDGEAIYECTVCKYTEKVKVDATNEHLYEQGVCVDCGREYADCDHSVLNEYTIDFSEYGCCESIITYQACECGERILIDEEEMEYYFACDFDMVSGDEGVTEDGIPYQTMVGRCEDCGLVVYGYMEAIQDECLYTITATYSFEKDGVKILENAMMFFEEEYHAEGSYTEINLADYGACGGYVSGYVCSVCGEMQRVDYFHPSCPMEEDELIFEEGEGFNRATVTCNVCGFTYVMEETETEEGCTVAFTESISIYNDEGELLFHFEEEHWETNHQWEETHELQGESCDDGVTVTRTCTVCGDRDVHTYYGHTNSQRNYIDLSEYGVCNGYIEYYECLCGRNNQCRPNISCEFDFEESSYTDESGVEHYVLNGVCASCGATISEDAYTEQDGCTTYDYVAITMAVGETKILEHAFVEDYSTNHAFVYTYEFANPDAPNCEDGVKVTTTCENCDYTANRDIHRHETFEKYYYLADNGGCDGYVRVYECPCGEVRNVDYSIRCISYVGASEYVDDDGVEHVVKTYACDVCHTVITEDTFSEKDGCLLTTYATYNITVGDNALISDYTENVGSGYEHNFIITYTETDGSYTVTAYCDVCGLRQEDSESATPISVEMERHEDGQYYYDYTFTPDTTATYSIRSYSDRDTYVTLYEKVGEELNQIDSDDDGAGNVQFYLSRTLTAGVTYVYRIGFLGYDEEGTISFVLTEGENLDSCRHNSSPYTFSIFLSDSGKCEDGVLRGQICNLCGQVRNVNVNYSHNTTWYNIDYSDYGACGGDIQYRACDCGYVDYVNEYMSCSYTSENTSYVDDDGVEHSVQTRRCTTCGLVFVRDQYTVQEGCYTYTYRTYTVSINGETIVELDGYRYLNSENHDYEYAFEFANPDAPNCEDGYTVYTTCANCDYSSQQSYSSHRTYQKEYYDLADYGACGGYVRVYECPCGEANSLEWNNGCSYQSATTQYVDDNGISHTVRTYTCNTCATVVVRDSFNAKEGCQRNSYYTYTITVGETEIVTDYTYIYSTSMEHTYEYTFEFTNPDAPNCEEGVRVIYTCADCGYSYYNNFNSHSELETYYDLADYGACDGYVSVHACPCGQERNVEWYSDCVEYVETTEYVDDNGITHSVANHVCEECNTAVIIDQYNVKEDCQRNHYVSFNITVGDNVILADYTYCSTVTYEHDFVVTYTETDGSYTVTAYCDVCGLGQEDDAVLTPISVEMERHEDGQYYYDYTFTPDTTATYSIRSYADRDTYVRLYEKVGEELNQIDSDDDSIGNQFYLSRTLTSGVTYVYRIGFYGYDEEGTISFVLTEGENLDDCRHNSDSYSFSIFLTDSGKCEDGVLRGQICNLCGQARNVNVSYSHNRTWYNINYSDYGACGGYIEYRACDCGYVSSVNEYMSCSYTSENTSYVDDDGVEHSVYTRRCTTCGLVFVRDQYTVQEGCYTYTYRTYTVSINGETIVELDGYRSLNSENHDYEYAFEFENPDAPNCEDGVRVRVTCANCDYSYEDYTSYHSTYQKEYYDLADYGACGGYVRVYECPCGEDHYLEWNNGCSHQSATTQYVDDNGISHTVRTYTCNTCATVVVRDSFSVKEGCQRNSYYTYTITVGETEIVTDYTYIYSTSMEHTYEYTFEFANPDAPNCENGYTVYTTCANCDYSSQQRYSSHNMYRKEYYNFTDYGACSGYYSYYECACGKESRHDYSSHGAGNSTQIQGDNGVITYVTAYDCATCGFRYQNSYYIGRNNETCEETQYHTLLVNVGDTLVVNKTYETSSIVHKYEVEGVLAEGATNCNQGVTLTYTCSDCGDTYQQNTTSHTRYVLGRIETEEHGNVCGGYLELYGCACGYNFEVRNTGMLCDIDSRSISCWVEDYLSGTCYTSNGETWYSSPSSYQYTCAVTEPQCAFTYRTSTYWLKEEDACLASRYTTVQIYNADTETWVDVAHIARQQTRTYHAYDSESISGTDDSGVTYSGNRYTCPDCGSYYEYKGYTVGNGGSKYDQYAVNTLANGENRSWYYIYESLYDVDGGDNQYERSRTETVDANGETSWSQWESTHDYDYVAPYGEGYYQYTCEDSNSSGYLYRNEYADTYITINEQRYQYRVYERHEYSSYWYRYDYTYNFDEGCVRTVVYTHSDGTSSTSTESAHRANYKLIKAPTCTQHGLYGYVCQICEEITDTYNESPYQHNWVCLEENRYCCTRCGLENANGANGSVIFEDLTGAYGEGENYVAGYYATNNVRFTYYVSLILHEPMEDGNDEVVLAEFTNFTELTDVRAVAFSISEVETLASELGYTADQYDVRLAFVPIGMDGAFDYAITFTDKADNVGTIVADISFVDYVGVGETNRYTIIPTETLIWTFTSVSNRDTYACLYDAEGNQLGYDNNNAGNNQFRILAVLEAGQTYYFDVKWNSTSIHGYLPVVISTQSFDEVREDAIVGATAFTATVGAGERIRYMIIPEETAVWSFTSAANKDTYGYLYDANGRQLVANDDGGDNAQFLINYTLQAGQIYYFEVRWYGGSASGDMPIIITTTAVA